MTDVTVIGTGAMGSAITRNLLASGRSVSVWNRDRARLAALAEVGATPVDDLHEAFATSLVLSVLADDRAVRDVVLDSGVLASAPAGTVHVNLATISPHLANEAAHAHDEQAVGYVAAPMFGGVAVAEARKLNIVVAGAHEHLARALPTLEAVSARACGRSAIRRSMRTWSRWPARS